MKTLVMDAIYEICENDKTLSEKLSTICQLKGGWEGWLQAELFVKIFNMSDKRVISFREVRVFEKSQQACDFLVEGDSDSQGCIVELKALGFARDIKAFLGDVRKDLAKLHKDNIVDDFRHLERISIVIIPGFNIEGFSTFNGPMTRMEYQCKRGDRFNFYVRSVKD